MGPTASKGSFWGRFKESSKEAIIFILLSSLNHIITESVAFYSRGLKPDLVE